MKSTLKTIGRLTFLKLIGSVLGLIYSILQVRYFGASSIVDAYFIATSAVYLITSLTQGGQLAEVFLPEYLSYKKTDGQKASSMLFSAVLNRVLVYVSLTLVVLYFLAPILIQLMGPGLDPSYQVLATSLFRASLILILFNIVASFVNAVLNAEQVFGRAEVTRVISSVTSILMLFLFFKKFGIWILVYALIVGKMLEFIIGLFFLKKIGFKYFLNWNVKNYGLKGFFQTILTTSKYVGATQLYNITLTAMSSYLPPGSWSIYNYINQLSTRTRSLLVGPVSTVFFSKFTNRVLNKRDKLEEFLLQPIAGLLFISTLQFWLVAVGGEGLLKILWEQKTLSQEYFTFAFWLLLVNMFGVAISSIGMIFRKSAIAIGFSKQLYTNWTYAQLLTAVFTFTVIYTLDNRGLILVPFVNMSLLSAVSYRTAIKAGIKGKKIWRTLINESYFSLVLMMSVIGTLIISVIPNISTFSTFETVITKVILYVILLVICGATLFLGRIKKTLKTWVK